MCRQRLRELLRCVQRVFRQQVFWQRAGVSAAGVSAAGVSAAGVLAAGVSATDVLAADVLAVGVLVVGVLAAGVSIVGVLAGVHLAGAVFVNWPYFVSLRRREYTKIDRPMRMLVLMLSGAVLLPWSMRAQAQADKYGAYEKKIYVSERGDTLRYRLLSPEEMKPGRKYPLVLFLHGAGERGSDNEKQLVHGGQMWLNPVNRSEHPCFVLAPQCPADEYWAYVSRPDSFDPNRMPSEPEMTPVFRSVRELLDIYLAQPAVDRDRIYVMGLSMGGMGTFDLAIRYPDLFAAAVPICGTVNAYRLPAAKGVVFRIFHGDADDVVPVEGSREAYKALKAAGAQVEYIEFPGVNHGSWNPAFNYPGFMDWLFRQKR